MVLCCTGIRVDVYLKSGKSATALLTHQNLEDCVGESIAAFANQMLFNKEVPAGVFFPEEVPGKRFRDEILRDASRDAIEYSYKL